MKVEFMLGMSLEATENYVLIKDKKREQIIPYDKIISVSLKPPGLMSRGMLTVSTSYPKQGLFEIPDTNSIIGAHGTNISFVHIGDFFEVERIQAFINDILKNPKPKESHISNSESSLDEIKKLKELLDIGAITQDEFDTKKKQLLNL